VSTLTASDLPNVQLSGMAMSGGADAVSLAVSGGQATTVSAGDSVLDLAPHWTTAEWNVFGQCCRHEADFKSDTSLVPLASFVASSGPAAPKCVAEGFTGETNNLTVSTTPGLGSFPLPTVGFNETYPASGSGTCATTAAAQPSPAPGLAVDGLTSTWAAQSDFDSTGSPQPLPTTTSDCGQWSGGDGTQVVRLNDGDDLWTFGDTFLGPAVARQDFFNNGFIHNSMVRQDDSAFTTITGGSGCASSQPITATAPITASGGGILWPASSIVYAGEVEKFYYTASPDLVQLQPQVAEIPQADLEDLKPGDTYSQEAAALSGCTANPIMWGTATISSGGYTYIYGSQQYSRTGGDTGGNGGELYLARTTGDPSDQGGWQYYTTSGWSPAGDGCDGLTLAALGGSEPIEVPTAFSVTSVNGDFWLVDEDPANGDQPGWAVAHEATTPTGFSDNAAATVDLFDPGQTPFSGINDSVPGLVHYAIGMLEPSAVTPSQPGSVVIAYNVNDYDVDQGCVLLDVYDANAYRPRFIDVPTGDLRTDLTAALSALRKSARTTASPGTAAKPATTAASGEPAQPGHDPEGPPAVSFSRQIAAVGEAQLKAASRAGSEATANPSFTYDPDAVPDSDGVTWGRSCPTSYKLITGGKNGDIIVTQNQDGSLEVSWPNEGPDVWYWFYWQDDTSDPGIWNKNEFWAEGPNADGYQPAQAGAHVSTGTGGKFGFGTIYHVFTLPAETRPGDTFSFWVQPFAAGNGNVTSGDSSANDISYTPTSPSETVSDLKATPGTDSVKLTWTAPPKPIEGQAIWYSVRFKELSQSTWTYSTDYITNSADMTPLVGGSEYEFEVAVTDYATKISSDANWSAPVDATPKT
jgi:hypothetical protein